MYPTRAPDMAHLGQAVVDPFDLEDHLPLVNLGHHETSNTLGQGPDIILWEGPYGPEPA